MQAKAIPFCSEVLNKKPLITGLMEGTQVSLYGGKRRAKSPEGRKSFSRTTDSRGGSQEKGAGHKNDMNVKGRDLEGG